MKIWWGIAYGLVLGLLAGAALYLVSSPPRGEPIHLLPPPSPPPLMVHIGGGVVHPGVYTLPRGSRVKDAIMAAGGVSDDANPQTLNLAAYVQDGERIWVPIQAPQQVQSPAGSIPLNTNEPSALMSGLININTGTQLELESLPGIGPVTARKIMTHRETKGPFSCIEDILNVSGIGPVTFEGIKDMITVAANPAPD
jgi:competence protein ComEA